MARLLKMQITRIRDIRAGDFKDPLRDERKTAELDISGIPLGECRRSKSQPHRV